MINIIVESFLFASRLLFAHLLAPSPSVANQAESENKIFINVSEKNKEEDMKIATKSTNNMKAVGIKAHKELFREEQLNARANH